MDIQKSTIKKQLLLQCLGIIEGIKQEIITMDEATRLLLKPYLPIWLDKYHFDQNFIDLIWKAIELEDLVSLGKDIFDQNLEEVYQDIIYELRHCNNTELISKSLCHFALKELEKKDVIVPPELTNTPPS